MSIKLSIVIPTYRRNDSLPRLLSRLSNQTHQDLDVVVVDQNPDASDPDWLKTAPAELPLRRLHLTEPNASTARNHGFLNTDGDIVLFIDDDLIPEADFCARGIEVMQMHEQTIQCLCPVIVVDGQVTGQEHVIPDTQFEETSCFRLKNSITAAVFFRRQYFADSGGFDELLFRFARTAEDQELFHRMTAREMPYWLDKSLHIDHDEKAPGGCELRTDEYWNTRERCIRSWVLRHRIHGGNRGRLKLRDIYTLSRSAFLNRGVLRSGITSVVRNIRLLKSAIVDSRKAIEPHLQQYLSMNSINHLATERATRSTAQVSS